MLYNLLCFPQQRLCLCSMDYLCRRCATTTLRCSTCATKSDLFFVRYQPSGNCTHDPDLPQIHSSTGLYSISEEEPQVQKIEQKTFVRSKSIEPSDDDMSEEESTPFRKVGFSFCMDNSSSFDKDHSIVMEIIISDYAMAAIFRGNNPDNIEIPKTVSLT